MGAWGMSPFENDDFGDLNAEVERSVSEKIKGKTLSILRSSAKLAPSTQWGAIGVAIRAFHSGYLDNDQAHDITVEAAELYNSLEADPDFFKSWRNPGAFKKMWKRVGDELTSMGDYGNAAPVTTQLFKLFEQPLPRRAPRRRR